MPCDSIQVSTVDIGKLDPVLARAAIEALRATGDRLWRYVAFTDGALQVSGGVPFTDELKAQFKQAYSAQVVAATAKRYGWTVKEAGQNKFALSKR